MLKNKIKFGKKKFKDYPQYVESVRNTLRRKLKDNSGTAFIKRQINGKKYDIPFLNLRNINSFEESKMGVVSSVILRFNEQFSGMARIEFEDINYYISFDCVKHDKKADMKFIEEKLKSSEIYIADKINDDYSKEFCKDLKKLIFDEYHIQSEIKKRIVKNSLNICLIHNAEYYVEKNDPYQIQYSDTIVKYITFEDFKLLNNKGKPSSAIAQAIHELMIKADLMNNKITLFNWADMGIDHQNF